MSLTNKEIQELEQLQKTKRLAPTDFMRRWELEITKELLQDDQSWDMPECGKEFLTAKGIDIASSFLYSNGWTYDIPNNFDGTVITLTGKVYEYEFEYSEDFRSIKQAEFADITEQTNLLHNNKGVPMTREAVALAVLRRFQAQQPISNQTNKMANKRTPIHYSVLSRSFNDNYEP